jgi:hypothetical protein
MGADLYLNSILKPLFDDIESDRSAAWQKLEQQRDFAETVEEFKQIPELFYEFFRASGGYFRNGYNSGDVMWAMGLSWRDTVGPMLNSERRLPIARAKELLDLIDARPLTTERIAKHMLEHMTNGKEEHPAIAWIAEQTAASGGYGPASPPDFHQTGGLPMQAAR